MWRRIEVRGKVYALVPTSLFMHTPDYQLEWGSPCHACPYFTYDKESTWSSCSAMQNAQTTDAPCHQRFREDTRSATFVPIELAVQLRLEE
jgi:hypothetical protein